MWESIRGWILTIAAAVLLFVLLDMLLPNGGVKKVARMALGLLLVAIMVSPLVELLTGTALEVELRQYMDAAEQNKMELYYENKSHKDSAWEVYTRNHNNINGNED